MTICYHLQKIPERLLG